MFSRVSFNRSNIESVFGFRVQTYAVFRTLGFEDIEGFRSSGVRNVQALQSMYFRLGFRVWGFGVRV